MYQYSYDTVIGKIYIAEKDNCICNVSFGTLNYKEKETYLIKKTYSQLKEYFAGNRKSFDIPISANGTEFQIKVWKELQKIPYGKTATYKEIAENIGNKNASRAVGMANNKNPIAIIIPCHRVIGSNGNLTGYAGGINIKKILLNLEKQTLKNNIFNL